MWFVFPQLAGLGSSHTAKRFALGSAEEAKEYLAHPVLGPRLLETAGALVDLEDGEAEAIFGGVDAMKLRSSMTLFAEAAADVPVFRKVLDRYYGGEPDRRTLELLRG